MHARHARLRRATTSAIAATIVATATFAAPARARPYSINECSSGDAILPAPTDWPKTYAQTADNNCSPGGGTLDVISAGLQLGTTAYPSVATGFQWFVPAKTPNVKITYALLYVGASDQTEGSASGITVGATTNPTDNATPDLGTPLTTSGKVNGWGTDTAFEYKDLSTRSLQFLYKCTSNCYFSGPTLRLRRALLQLDDPLSPSGITTAATGLLDGASQSGTRTLTFTAHDADSGVYSVDVKAATANDAPSLAYAEKQQCDYVTPVACAQNPTYSLPVDTTKLPNGVQTLHVLLTDAAANQRWVDLPPITVDNSGLVSGPSGGGATPVPTSTPGASGTPVPSPTPGPFGQTPAGVAPVPTLAKLTTTAKKGDVHTGYGEKATITGHLVDRSGQPIGGATIDVFERVDAVGAEAKTKTASLTTDAKGVFTYSPSTRSSRTVEFAYGALDSTGDYAQTASVALHVQAKVTASISTTTARLGQAVTITGRVFASPLPKRGVAVNVQFWQHGRWRGLEVLHTTQAGTFAWTYRFRTAGNFTIRVTAIGSSDLPASPGSSRVLRIKTR